MTWEALVQVPIHGLVVIVVVDRLTFSTTGSGFLVSSACSSSCSSSSSSSATSSSSPLSYVACQYVIKVHCLQLFTKSNGLICLMGLAWASSSSSESTTSSSESWSLLGAMPGNCSFWSLLNALDDMAWYSMNKKREWGFFFGLP